MKKSASVYSRGNWVVVRSEAKTDSGFHIGDGAVSALDASDVQGVGAAVLAALDYRTGVPTPPRDAKLGGELYAAAGAKSWNDFVVGAKMLSVLWEDGQITLSPWKNAGARDSFVALEESRDRVIPDTSPELGAAVIAALADAQ